MYAYNKIGLKIMSKVHADVGLEVLDKGAMKCDQFQPLKTKINFQYYRVVTIISSITILSRDQFYIQMNKKKV